MRFALSFLLVVTAASPALAGEGGYVAGGVEIGRYSVDDSYERYKGVALNLRLGYDFDTYFGVEAEGTFHIGGAATSGGTFGSTNFEQSNDVTGRIGGYMRGRLPISEKADFFVRAGLGGRLMTDKTETIGVVNGTSFDDVTSYSEINLFVSVGIGSEIEIGSSGRDLIRADYTRYSTFIGYWVVDDAVSVAYAHRF